VLLKDHWRSWYTPKTLQQYDRFVETFGYDDVVMIAIKGSSGIENEAIVERIEKLTNDLEALDIVSHVTSLTSDPMLHADTESLRFDFLSDINPKERNRLIEKNDLVDYLTDHKMQNYMIIVHIADRFSQAKEDPSAEILSKIRGVLSRYPIEYRLFGSTVVTNAFTLAAEADVFTVIPAMLLLISLLLFFLFRRRDVVGIYWAIVISTLLILFAILTLLGHPLNNFTINLPLFIVVISLSDVVHLLIGLRYYQQKMHNANKAYRETLKANFLPILITSLTTGVGFLSLASSEIVPVQHLGVAVALATVIVFGMTLLFLWLWYTSSYPALTLHPVISHSIKSLQYFISRKYRAIVVGFVGVFLLVAFGIFRLTIDSNLLHYFKADAPLVKDIRWIQDRITGVVNYEIILDTHRKGGALDPKFLKSTQKYTRCPNRIMI